MSEYNYVAVPALLLRLRGGVVRRNDWHESTDDFATEAVMEEAADMLEFFFGQMQMYSPKMNGQHSYRFRGGWPMTHCIGPSAEDAVKAAIEEIKRSRSESA